MMGKFLGVWRLGDPEINRSLLVSSTWQQAVGQEKCQCSDMAHGGAST